MGDGIALAKNEAKKDQETSEEKGEKTTLNGMRKEHGLEPMPDGNVTIR